MLAGNIHSWACIPLSFRLHNGLQTAMERKGVFVSSVSHVVQIVERLKEVSIFVRGDCPKTPERR